MVSCGQAGGTLLTFPFCEGLRNIWRSIIYRFRYPAHSYYIGLFSDLNDADNNRASPNAAVDQFVNS